MDDDPTIHSHELCVESALYFCGSMTDPDLAMEGFYLFVSDVDQARLFQLLRCRRCLEELLPQFHELDWAPENVHSWQGLRNWIAVSLIEHYAQHTLIDQDLRKLIHKCANTHLGRRLYQEALTRQPIGIYERLIIWQTKRLVKDLHRLIHEEEENTDLVQEVTRILLAWLREDLAFGDVLPRFRQRQLGWGDARSSVRHMDLIYQGHVLDGLTPSDTELREAGRSALGLNPDQVLMDLEQNLL